MTLYRVRLASGVEHCSNNRAVAAAWAKADARKGSIVSGDGQRWWAWDPRARQWQAVVPPTERGSEKGVNKPLTDESIGENQG